MCSYLYRDEDRETTDFAPRAHPQRVRREKALIHHFSKTRGQTFCSLAFDGANIWVTDFGGGNVTKLRASDGANLGTFPVGRGPAAIAFDGTSIWVANSNSNSVTKLRACDGMKIGEFATGLFPFAVAFDGTNIWVANANSNTVSKVYNCPACPPNGRSSGGEGSRDCSCFLRG